MKRLSEMTSDEQSAYVRERLGEIVERFRELGYPDDVIALGATAAYYRFASDHGFSREAADAMLERFQSGREPS